MVYHILKDGTRVNDIKGRVVRYEEARPLYNLVQKINSNLNNNNTYGIKEVRV